MKLIHRLAGKWRTEAYGDVPGYLTKEDVRKIMAASRRPRSAQRKASYTTWICALCGYQCFYRVERCPACEYGRLQRLDNEVKS